MRYLKVLVITLFWVTVLFLPTLVKAQGPPDGVPPGPGASLQNRVAALEATVATQQTEIETLQTDLTNAQNIISQLESNPVLALEQCVSFDGTNTLNGVIPPHVIFDGCNIHVRDGTGSTSGEEGLGNVIIGYNEDSDTPNDRTGSHNLIIGPQHTYSSFGGFVAGSDNSIIAPFSSVSGGVSNLARGDFSSVSGGLSNVARGDFSSVSGGLSNVARGPGSSVSGGVSNEASGQQSSVSGGLSNEASGQQSSVSGGLNHTASGVHDWRAGSLFEDF